MKYQWTCLRRPREMRGHKFFADHTGRIAIADWSGDTPDETDDGVLWLDSTRPLSVQWRRGEHIHVFIPLADKNGNPTYTVSDVRTAEAAMRLCSMRVETDSAELRLLTRMLASTEPEALAEKMK